MEEVLTNEQLDEIIRDIERETEGHSIDCQCIGCIEWEWLACK